MSRKRSAGALFLEEKLMNAAILLVMLIVGVAIAIAWRVDKWESAQAEQRKSAQAEREKAQVERMKCDDPVSWYWRYGWEYGGNDQNQKTLRVFQVEHPEGYQQVLAALKPVQEQIAREAERERRHAVDPHTATDHEELEVLRIRLRSELKEVRAQAWQHEIFANPVAWYKARADRGFRSEKRALATLQEVNSAGYQTVVSQLGANRELIVAFAVAELNRLNPDQSSTLHASSHSYPAVSGDAGLTWQQKRELEDILAEERRKAVWEATARAYMLDHMNDK